MVVGSGQVRSIAGTAVALFIALTPFGAAATAGDEAEYVRIIDNAFALRPYGPIGDRVLHNLTQNLVSNCMREQGFEFVIVPFAEPFDASDALALAPPLPGHDEIDAKGYDAFQLQYETTETPEIADAQASNLTASADPGWSAAIFGTNDEGGCLADADASIRERADLVALDQWASLTESFAPTTNPYLSEDPELAEAKRQWVACMNDSGFDEPGPFEVQDLFYRESGTSPTDIEIVTAHADRDCRESSGFRDAFLAAIAHGVANWQTENEGAISELVATTERETEALVAMAEEIGVG